MTTINRNSPIPAYFQIASHMRGRILRQEWQVKEQLPPEVDLADYYGVSKMTMRQALIELVKEGLLVRKRGSGTFINPDYKHTAPPLSFPINFSLRLRELGLTPTSQMLQRKIMPVSETGIADKLKFEPSEDVIYIQRLLLGDGQPIAINLSILPAELCPELIDVELIDNSVSKTLEQKFDLIPDRAEHWLEAVRASKIEANLLETDPGAPLLLLTAQSYAANQRPLEFSLTSWVGDRMRLSVEIVPLD